MLERGADGKLRPKKKKININDLDADTLRKLGIDPNLSKKEIAKKLKVLKNYIEPFRLECYDGQTVLTNSRKGNIFNFLPLKENF